LPPGVATAAVTLELRPSDDGLEPIAERRGAVERPLRIAHSRLAEQQLAIEHRIVRSFGSAMLAVPLPNALVTPGCESRIEQHGHAATFTAAWRRPRPDRAPRQGQLAERSEECDPRRADRHREDAPCHSTRRRGRTTATPRSVLARCRSRPRTGRGEGSGRLQRAELLIVDELGFVPFDRTGGELLFNLLAERYERRSTIITTNLAFSEWPKVFGDDEKLTAALLDRLADRATVIATKGKSYRQRRKSVADKKSTSKGSATVADPV
jgi:hypothetical protein